MRADLYLTVNGHTESRQRAKRLIAEGGVKVDGKTLKKASEEIADGEHRVEITDSLSYVGRGGCKLEAALDAFSLNPFGKTALDIGASTGGFTDCLLQRGAERVFAVDSGAGQLAKQLLEDDRVVSMEHCNARYLELSAIGKPVDLIVMDVSFISATYLIPKFPEFLKPDGHAVCLIKPQFEVGRSMVGKGGIVKDPSAHAYAIEKVLESGRTAGFKPVGLIPSPVKGGDGNREFLVHFSLQSDAKELTGTDIRQVVR